jgi:hypothetical protein
VWSGVEWQREQDPQPTTPPPPQDKDTHPAFPSFAFPSPSVLPPPHPPTRAGAPALLYIHDTATSGRAGTSAVLCPHNESAQDHACLVVRGQVAVTAARGDTLALLCLAGISMHAAGLAPVPSTPESLSCILAEFLPSSTLCQTAVHDVSTAQCALTGVSCVPLLTAWCGVSCVPLRYTPGRSAKPWWMRDKRGCTTPKHATYSALRPLYSTC